MRKLKRVKPNEFRNRLEVYEQVNIQTPYGYETEWKLAFKCWCRVRTIYRVQLEGIVSGGNTLRDRKEFETRYTNKITTLNRVKYKGDMYEISISGDTEGNRKTIRFLGEALKDGGL